MEGVLTVLCTSFIGGFIGGAIAVNIIAKDLLKELGYCIREVKQLREEILIYRCIQRRATETEIERAKQEAKERSNLAK